MKRSGGDAAARARDRSTTSTPFRPRGIYLVLGALFVLAVAATLVWPGNWLAERFAPNLATEALGILITLVFVHRFLEQQERARRLRGSIGALRKGSRALTRLVEPWAALVKGARGSFPSGPPQTVDELFAPHMVEALVDLDPCIAREVEGAPPERWVRWAAREFDAARASLEAIIASYGSVLDPAYVEAIDELVDDPFLRLVARLAEADDTTASSWRVRLNLARAARATHFEQLQMAVRLHNQLAAEAASVRSRHSAPRSGTIGVELPLDHDLRASIPLDPSWWRADPQPGSLRAAIDAAPRR